jgi:hypothetical protein
MAGTCRTLVDKCRDKETDGAPIGKELVSLKNSLAGQYRNYRQEVDRELFRQLIRAYFENLDTGFSPPFFSEIKLKYKGDIDRFTQDMFASSIFDSEKTVMDLLDHFKPSDHKKIARDPAYKLAIELRDYYFYRLAPAMQVMESRSDSLMRIYMKAQMELLADKRFYPDANSTLRVAYGRVAGYTPADAVRYDSHTTLAGIIMKEDPDIYDYIVDDRLKELYSKADYGCYADQDGTLHTCFIATNHTSGGNSGSPVLNAEGHLIGINFDRCWEGTMSDLMYDPDMCRNISLDIRYCLFIIDKFAGARHLINEMTLIE